MVRTLIIRADASIEIGTGHVIRCLALAQAWQDAGGNVIFAMAESTPAIDSRLRSEAIEVVHLKAVPNSSQDVQDTSTLGRDHRAAWIVIDGYQFDSHYQRNLKNAGQRLLWVDDLGRCEHYSADIVLNQNVHAHESMYAKRETCTRLLLGTRFAMLRRDFKSWSRWHREVALQGRKILVTMGGSDPDNVTAVVLEALGKLQVDGLEIIAILGGSNPHLDLPQRFANTSLPVRFVRDATTMPELMAWSDIAVSAAGSTCAEASLLGLPSILIDVALNQQPIARELSRRQAAIHLGSSKEVTAAEITEKVQALLLSADRRVSLSKRSRELVDGEGAERVRAAICGGDLRLRRVQEKDCRQLWEWANDPQVRPMSFSSEPIPWTRHVEWFNSKLRDPNTVLYLLVDSSEAPVGQVRFQIECTKAAVFIGLSAQFRGKGYGVAALKMATEALFRTNTVTQIDAYVKQENLASIRLFERAGYSREGTEMIRAQEAIHFVLQKTPGIDRRPELNFSTLGAGA